MTKVSAIANTTQASSKSVLGVAARLGLWLEKSLEGSAAKLLSKDEARRIAANIAKLPELLGGSK